MPRVYTQKARKDYPKEGIKKGDTYYKWSIKTGPASGIDYRSLKPPKPSQLTGSAFMQEYYSIQEDMEGISAETAEDLKSQVEEFIGRIENLRDETQGIWTTCRKGFSKEMLASSFRNGLMVWTTGPPVYQILTSILNLMKMKSRPRKKKRPTSSRPGKLNGKKENLKRKLNSSKTCLRKSKGLIRSSNDYHH